MTSILTNTSSMLALQVLRNVNGGLEKTQNEASTGLRVAKASDNAVYWSIATTMRSDNAVLSAVDDDLGLEAAQVDATYTAISSVNDLVSEFKAKLVAAKEPGVDKTKINDELTQLKQQMRSVAYSASFNGVNWLAITDDNWHPFVQDRTVPGYIVRSGDSFSVGTVKILNGIDNVLGGTEQMYPLVDDTGGDYTGADGILTNFGYSQVLGTDTNWVVLHTAGNPSSSVGTEITLSNDTSEEDVDDMISVTNAMQRDIVKWTAHLGGAQAMLSAQQEMAPAWQGDLGDV